MFTHEYLFYCSVRAKCFGTTRKRFELYHRMFYVNYMYGMVWN